MEQQPQIRGMLVYSEEFKRRVIEEYLAGGISQRGIARKYKLGANSAVVRWMKQLGYAVPLVSIKFASIIHPDLAKSSNNKQTDSDLLKRIKELERQLQDEKLRSEAYARIIDKAEKELKIPIRKKHNSR
jgi:transposase